MKDLIFIFKQIFSNAVILVVVMILLILGCLQVLHIKETGYMLDIFPKSVRTLGLFQVLAAIMLLCFIVYNAMEDYQIWKSVKTDAQETKESIFSALQTTILSKTGLMLLSVGVFASTAIWVSVVETTTASTLFQYILLSEVGSWNTIDLVNHDFINPITVMVATSLILMFFSLSVAIVLTAVYLCTLALPESIRNLSRVGLKSIIVPLGGIPFILPLLFFRRILYNDILNINAIFQHSDPVPQFAYVGTEGIVIGIVTAGLFLGLQVASTLVQWLDSVETRVVQSANFRLSQLRKRSLFKQVLREGMWLSYRQELVQTLLSGFSAILLTDFLSGALLETLVILSRGSDVTMFSLYPSLGSIIFYTEMVTPTKWLGIRLESAPFAVSILMASLTALLIIARIPSVRKPSFIVPTGGGYGDLYLPNLRKLTTGVSLGKGWTHIGINYVLGESGTGKTTYMKALQERYLTDSVAIPQDPDSYFPADMSVADVMDWVVGSDQKRRKKVEHILQRTEDTRILNTLDDVLTPVSLLSRGERQRFLFALAWSKVRCRAEDSHPQMYIFMDEFTSAQDYHRSDKMWAEIYDTLKSTVSEGLQYYIFIATHDPESLKRSRWYLTENRTFWFSQSVGKPAKMEQLMLFPTLKEDEFSKTSKAFEEFDQNLKDMEIDAEKPLKPNHEGGGSILRYKFPEKGISLGPNTLFLSEATRELHLSPKTLYLLEGPSGMGKSTLLGKIITANESAEKRVNIGWIPQDPGRAFPDNMTVAEALLLHDNNQDKEVEIATFMGYKKEEVSFWHRPIYSLSEGQRQRVCIAREYFRLSENKSVMILDEPFGSLDPKNHRNIMLELKEWALKGSRSLLMISHTPKIEAGIAGGVAEDDGDAPSLNVVRWQIEPAKDRQNGKTSSPDESEVSFGTRLDNWKWYSVS